VQDVEKSWFPCCQKYGSFVKYKKTNEFPDWLYLKALRP
jgi:hypothetical protein